MKNMIGRKSLKAAIDPAEGRGRPAMGELFRSYGGDLRHFIWSIVGEGPPDPEDIAQQTFANYAASRLKNESSIDNPRAFLFRTASNLIKDYFKSAAARSTVQIGDADIDEYNGELDELTPEVVLLSRERYACVMGAVETLTRRQKRFLVLNRLNGLSYREIARQSGVGLATVARELEIALGVCRLALKDLDINDPAEEGGGSHDG